MSILQILINYLICSEILMMVFLIININELKDSYINFENKRDDVPSSKWYTFYIITHLFKAPFLAPSIALLILLNGGKILSDKN